jgi:hypothetical protein
LREARIGGLRESCKSRCEAPDFPAFASGPLRAAVGGRQRELRKGTAMRTVRWISVVATTAMLALVACVAEPGPEPEPAPTQKDEAKVVPGTPPDTEMRRGGGIGGGPCGGGWCSEGTICCGGMCCGDTYACCMDTKPVTVYYCYPGACPPPT